MSAALDVRSPVPVTLDRRCLSLRVDPDDVLRFQGYKKGRDIPDATVLALFDEALALGESLMEPRFVYRAAKVTGQGPDVIQAGGEKLHIPEIGRLWGTLEAVGAGICTVGCAIEDRVRELWEERELPLAMMLDSVGSAAVESLAEYVNDLLCQAAIPSSMRVTNRVSPGYAGWDTASDVTLNDSCVMVPGKSISILVGIGPEARVDHYFTQCRRCWMRDCDYRRAPAATTVHR